MLGGASPQRPGASDAGFGGESPDERPIKPGIGKC